ncbi:MAG: PAS domain-containing protein [Rhizobium sp.]
MWDDTIDTDTLYCDPRWSRIMGRDPATSVTSLDDFRRHIHPDDVGRATSLELTRLGALTTEDRDRASTFRIIRPDGQIRWLRSTACLIERDAGAPNRVVGVIMDITETARQGGARNSFVHAGVTQ